MALLTDTKARSIKPGSVPLAHGAVAGLTLHPSPPPTTRAKASGFFAMSAPSPESVGTRA